MLGLLMTPASVFAASPSFTMPSDVYVNEPLQVQSCNDLGYFEDENGPHEYAPAVFNESDSYVGLAESCDSTAISDMETQMAVGLDNYANATFLVVVWDRAVFANGRERGQNILTDASFISSSTVQIHDTVRP